MSEQHGVRARSCICRFVCIGTGRTVSPRPGPSPHARRAQVRGSDDGNELSMCVYVGINRILDLNSSMGSTLVTFSQPLAREKRSHTPGGPRDVCRVGSTRHPHAFV